MNTNGNIFAYTGHVYDDSTGLHYAKARYYDPTAGRFISEDAYKGDINEPVSLSLYTYCANSPIMFLDSSGHLREPGYVNGVWCLDPDATEFGKDSATYQSLVTLGNLYNGTKDSDKRNQYHELADNIRLQARSPKFNFSLVPRPTFVADNTQGIYYSPENSLVKMFGYNDIYDIVFGAASDMDTIKMEFDNFRIQF